MSLVQRLQQKQTQSLVMTPQLAQSIKLLQFSHRELFDFVRDEVEKNPLLELGDSAATPPENRQQIVEATSNGGSENGIENVASVMASGDMSASTQLDTSFENVFDPENSGGKANDKSSQNDSGPIGSGSTGGNRSDDGDFDLLTNMGEAIDLGQYLERQISVEFKSPGDRDIATYIAHGVDSDGYFKEPLDEAAEQTNTTVQNFERVLKEFHRLEPVGIGARNLAECLSIQLIDLNRFDPAMQALVANLEMLAKREFGKLMQICGVDRDDFAEMIAEIRALDPRPARNFEPVLSETVVPDVMISQSNSGDWNIELNPNTLPKVIVDRDYHVQISAALQNTEGEKFVADCADNANWLTRTLDQRAQTILKVAAEIVKKQDRFFAEGKQYLKPLTLKTVADAIKMHESTVSRVTSNKFLHCDHGTFELKFFFSSAISASDGEEMVSSEAVKYKIRQMIDAEPPCKILSDEQIVNNLQEAGIEIARRTGGHRRSSDALKAKAYVEDKDSGELRRPHHIDLKSGMYRGRQVLEPKDSV